MVIFRRHSRCLIHAPLSNDPVQRIAFLPFVVRPYFRVQKYSDRANQPVLPCVSGDNCEALYLLLVVFYEFSMIFESSNILPAVESGPIDQQPDFPELADNGIDLR